MKYLNIEVIYISAIFTILSILIFLKTPNFDISHYIVGTLYFKDIIVYLFAASILKTVLVKMRISNTNIINEKAVYYYGFLSTFAFGLATPSFIKSIYPKSNYAWLTRWVCLSMFFLPTTVASAYIFDTLNIHLTSILVVSLPLLPMFICFFPIKVVWNRTVILLSIIAIVNMSLVFLLRAYVGISLLFGQAIIFCIFACYICRKMHFNVNSIMRHAISDSLINTIFFISIGLFMLSFKNSLMMEYIESMKFNSLYFCVFFTLVVIPIITLFFIHPLLLYVSLFNKINLCLQSYFNIPEIYLIWVFVFIAAQLCSPASIASILAAKSENISLLKVSVFRHSKFCIQLLAIILGYTLVVRWLYYVGYQ